MPGFFSSTMANQLTESSSHLVDWSRVGELLASGRHRYTWQQLFQRGVVVAGMAGGAYQGYAYADEDHSILRSSLYSMAGCFVGFVVSHIVVIAPLIYKRSQKRQDCLDADAQISKLLTDLQEEYPSNDQIKLICERVLLYKEVVMELSLSNEKGSKASQTWGRRSSLMTDLLDALFLDITLIKSTKDQAKVLEHIASSWTKTYDDFQETFYVAESISSSI